MTYEEAIAEFFKTAGIKLPKWQEDLLDQIYKLEQENPKKIIEIIRGGRGSRVCDYIFIARAIEDFRKNEVKQKMTYEQAHKILEELLRAMTYHRLLFSGDMLKAIGAAVEAVEYRIPKRPKKSVLYSVLKYSEIEGYTCLCPTCGEKVHFGERCQNCGQTLDWSDEDTRKDGRSFDRMYFDELKPKESENADK